MTKPTKRLAAKNPKLSRVETNHLVLPSHANALGTLFGGVLMGWIDIAAAISAQRHSGSICVTASIDALYFLSPIFVGDAVTIVAEVVYTGRTSMIVDVHVTRSKPGVNGTNHCVRSALSMVALDANRKPTPVAPLLLKTSTEKKRFGFAAKRRDFLLKRLKAEQAGEK